MYSLSREREKRERERERERDPEKHSLVKLCIHKRVDPGVDDNLNHILIRNGFLRTFKLHLPPEPSLGDEDLLAHHCTNNPTCYNNNHFCSTILLLIEIAS